MTIILERFEIPERGVLNLDLHESIEIRVTAEEARRKVNSWLIDQVSYMMHAEAPTLVISKQIVWRVPAVFTASQIGTVGTVGMIDVSIENGHMDATTEHIVQFQQCAREMAKKLPPYQPEVGYKCLKNLFLRIFQGRRCLFCQTMMSKTLRWND